MPRYSAKDRYQVGDYWLSQKSNSPAWYRTFYDSKTRQTRRVSLGTTDFGEAKALLNEWFILEKTRTNETPQEVSLAELFARYYEHYGSTLRTADSVQRALRDWLDFHGEATVSEACAMPRQHAFQKHLKSERGMKGATARRTITIGKAALNWAFKRGEITAVPYIELVKISKAPPKGRPLSVAEVAMLLENADYHLKSFIVLMIATTARTKAVLELTFGQIDFEHDLIHLNQDNREQTNKYRPTVKLPLSIKPWLAAHKEQAPTETAIHFRGAPVSSIRSAWRSLRTDLKLDDEVQPYSLRHTMARWLRKSSVPAWEVAAQLGHRMSDVSTTEIYAPFDPAYLKASTEAIDAFFCQLACQLRVKTLSYRLIADLNSL